jgi:protein-disulfide isomerase
MSLGLVFRDMDLASSNQVTGTPTLFVNGHRVAGVKDAAQLRQLISEALKDAPANIALNAGAPKK